MSEEIMNIGSAEGDQVLELDINRLRAFKNHPFKVTADMSMVELKDSIEKYGILNPLIVRPVPEGYYEIISGHRRKFAAKQLGYTKVPVIIKVMKNDEAIVFETISPRLYFGNLSDFIWKGKIQWRRRGDCQGGCKLYPF